MPTRELITRLGGPDYPAKVKIVKKEISSLEDLFELSSEQGYLRSDNSLEALYEPHLERFSKSYAEPRASARAESHSERTLAVPDVWYTK